MGDRKMKSSKNKPSPCPGALGGAGGVGSCEQGTLSSRALGRDLGGLEEPRQREATLLRTSAQAWAHSKEPGSFLFHLGLAGGSKSFSPPWQCSMLDLSSEHVSWEASLTPQVWIRFTS